ncbi:MAG: NAD(P)H-hydrate dehydratase [bacterium]|nr:NAD(P)H-hydrate dehydratase [bacterium]
MNIITVSKNDIQLVYPDRSGEVNKYDYGLVTVIGGSEFYSGAPALSALAAFRGGADMARVIAPRRAADIIASFSPILAAYPLEGSHITPGHVPTLVALAESSWEVSRQKACVVIGGGLGRSEETLMAMRDFLLQTSLPVVADADALYAIAENPEGYRGRNLVVTPNVFEFSLLTKRNIRELSLEERISVVQEEASRLGMIILLKGKTDIISDGSRVILNEEESSYLSVRGVGDTLSGILAALLARGVEPVQAGAVAAYINARAGSLASKEKRDGLVATDLIDYIPQAITSSL